MGIVQVIHKYPLTAKPGEVVGIEMPIGAKIIHFDLQNNGPVMWAMVGAVRDLVRKRKFAVVGTGWDIPDDAEYIGTFIAGGEFVWHVIEQKSAPLLSRQ